MLNKNIKNSLLLVIGFLIIGGSMLFAMTKPLQVKAASIPDTRGGLDITAGKITAFQGQTGQNFDSAFFATAAGRIIGLILSFVGILFLGLIIYAGISWMMAGGNEQTITKSKDLLVNAVIGLVIVFAAYAITIFVSNQFIGAPVEIIGKIPFYI